MYTRMPYQNMGLQATGSSMWYTVPMAPQEPNLNFLLIMIQMMSQMKKFQYQPISAPNLQQPAELDILSMILRSQQKSFVMDEVAKSQVPHEETREREEYEVLSSEQVEMQQKMQKALQDSEEKDALLKKVTEQLEDMAAENEKIKKELMITKEELESCRKTKEEEIKCNSVDNLRQVTVLGPIAGWHSVALSEGFRPESKIVIRGRAEKGVPRLNVNFKYPEGTALHVDNRWNYLDSEEKVVMNSYIKDSWGQEETFTPAPIARGTDFVISVQCENEEFKICVNGSPFATYSHRVNPKLITTVDIDGAAEITSVYYQGIEGLQSRLDNDNSSLDEDDMDDLLGYYLGVR